MESNLIYSSPLPTAPDPVVMLTDLHYTATVELSPLAPEDTAKDINLVMQLPKGLELKTVTTAAGTCDKGALILKVMPSGIDLSRSHAPAWEREEFPFPKVSFKI